MRVLSMIAQQAYAEEHLMYGLNEKMKQEVAGHRTLWVQEIFKTIQGEGPFTGLPAIFVRLAGCNLACRWCDTDFTTSKWHGTTHEIFRYIMNEIDATHRLVVITGGEPLRQDIGELIRLLNEHEIFVQIETAGTLYWDWIPRYFRPRSHGHVGRNTIVCSPKTPKLNLQLCPYINYLKYIIVSGEVSDADGLPTHSTQTQGSYSPLIRPHQIPGGPFVKSDIYVHACDQGSNSELTAFNMKAAAMVCEKHGYRLGVQVHKLFTLR